jgi:trehalose 6-phosphate phosphatase
VTHSINALLEIVQTRRRGRQLLLLLDYDGTLVPIAPHPAEARPTPELLDILTRLRARPDYTVMVVSGRPLADLVELLPVPGLDLLGSHGGEGRVGGRPWTGPPWPGSPWEINLWRRRLLDCLHGFSGWRLEDKPLGFALHYRQVAPARQGQLLEALAPWRQEVRRSGNYHILTGKKVLEVLPAGVSKGAALWEILSAPSFSGSFPVYLGDDDTDETVFAVLRQQGLTVKVGDPGPATAAANRLESPAQVRQFLARLAEL